MSYGFGAQREATPLSPSPSPPHQSPDDGAAPSRRPHPGEVIDLTTDSPPPAADTGTGTPLASRLGYAPGLTGLAGGPSFGSIPDDPNVPSFHRTAAAQFNPPSQAHAELEEHSRAVVGAFYDLAVRAADVERGHEHLVLDQVKHTVDALASLSQMARRPEIKATLLNPDVLNMVDASRNPDVHSRTLVNRLVSDNQQMRGQSIALHMYQTQLTAALAEAFPTLAEHLPPVPDRPVWTEVAPSSDKSDANGEPA